MASKETGGTGQYGQKQEGEPQEREDNSIKGRHPSSIFFFPLPLCISLFRSSRANGSLACQTERVSISDGISMGAARTPTISVYPSASDRPHNVQKKGEAIYPKCPLALRRIAAELPIYFPTTTEAIGMSISNECCFWSLLFQSPRKPGL